jgi:hypothetical protein
MHSFKKKPFKERLKDTGFLIKNSFTVASKDKDIKTPTIHMIVLSFIIITLIYISIASFFFGMVALAGIALLLFTLIILVPFSFFYNTRQKANQSWIVYNTISGKDISYQDAHEHTKHEKGKLRLIAIIDIVMKYAMSQRNGKGILNIVINIFLSFLNEVWDLLSHYMLPAIVIEQKSLKELVPQIKALKTNVPATLVGVFGIDFVGKVVGTLFGGIFFVGLLISVGIGYLIGLFTTVTVVTIGGLTISWLPIVIGLYCISIIGTVYKKIVESVKVIYFTIFYTSITRPMAIVPTMREELTHYLLMQEGDFKKPQPVSSHDQYIGRLTTYIKQYKQSGYTNEQLKQYLLTKGYKEADIDEAMSNTK